MKELYRVRRHEEGSRLFKAWNVDQDYVKAAYLGSLHNARKAVWYSKELSHILVARKEHAEFMKRWTQEP